MSRRTWKLLRMRLWLWASAFCLDRALGHAIAIEHVDVMREIHAMTGASIAEQTRARRGDTPAAIKPADR